MAPNKKKKPGGRPEHALGFSRDARGELLVRMTPTGNENRPQAWFCCVSYDNNTRLCKNHSEFHSYSALEDHINDFHNKTNKEKISIAPNNFGANAFNTNSERADPRRRDPPAYRSVFVRANRGSHYNSSGGTNANPGATSLFGTSRYHPREAEQFLRQQAEQDRQAEAQRRRDSFAARLQFHYGPSQPLPENAVVCYGYDGRVDPTIGFFESRPRVPTPPTPASIDMIIAESASVRERNEQRQRASQALRHQEGLESEAAGKGRICEVRCICM